VSDEPVFIPGTVKFETNDAWLITINDPKGTIDADAHGKDVWFPKSQCELHEDGLDVPQWLWDRKKNDL
jgi:hypothetical protein